MSSVVISVPKVAISMAPMMVPLAPIAAGMGLGFAAWKISQKLKSDYDNALRDLATRHAESDMAVKLWALQHDRMASAAQTAADAVGSYGVGGAADFVNSALAEAMRLAKEHGLEGMSERATELAEKMNDEANLEELAQEAVRLTSELHQSINQKAASGIIAPDLQKMVAHAKAEIDLIATAEEREPLIAQMTKLEAILDEESKVALQGIANLRERTGKILQTQISAERSKARRREVASQAVAMLQALSQVQDAPEATKALAMLEEISALFAKDTAPTLSQLEGFLNKARALYESCEARLNTAATNAYVADTVAETLMEMGYDVSHVPEIGAESCMVSLDEGTGLVVSFDDAGHMTTDMVAFDERSREPDMASQEKVCELVDEIFVALRKKDIEVKEKSRKTMKHGKLKLVKRPTKKVAAAATQSKERAIN